MLTGLSIRDIVLIDGLDLELDAGLTVLTGETGAGKSILLDALGLALGDRSDRGLLRTGATQGRVTARFVAEPGHPATALLNAQDIPVDGEILVRRTLSADGRSRAFIDDEPVGVALLRKLAVKLLAVHGQMEQHGLLDVATHRVLLDRTGDHRELAETAGEAHARWRELSGRLAEQEARIEEARREEEYLRHRLRELEELAAEAGEEERLADERQALMGREKLIELLREVSEHLSGGGGAIERLGVAQRRLERGSGFARERLQATIDALERALVEADEAGSLVETNLAEVESAGNMLESIEERLFGLRDMARKHRCAVDDLPGLLDDTRTSLSQIDAGVDALAGLQKEVKHAREALLEACSRLSEARGHAARKLEAQLHPELAPLKLDKARFRVTLDSLDEPGPDGAEKVAFEVSTNPGQPFGALARIASGGELSRLMLALELVLARGHEERTLVFDEIDAGIGGATADAVGERLARLAHERQVIVVTHAPQIAARADHHFLVEKLAEDDHTSVSVRELDSEERREEIARMLAGAEITQAARAAADSLMAVGAGQ